jgi:Fic family protein
MLVPSYAIPDLPPPADLDTKPILKMLIPAKAGLALLRGSALTIPNQGILIDTLSIQEAQASSEIENIITTQDDLYQGELFPDLATGPAKEVVRYRDALRLGLSLMTEQNGMITNRTVIRMFQLLKQRDDGFRTQMGTALKNERTGDIVYVPPQDSGDIIRHMTRLEQFINEDPTQGLDPLIRMAVIHHQFESIHPFSDGNGRLGRILNVLYLTRTGELDIPILYLSRHINRTKSDYYRLLQAVREKGLWEDWVVYMLGAIAETAALTLTMVNGIRDLMAEYKQRLRTGLAKIYSQDLLNNLFRHPYTRIEFVMRDLDVSRPTAARYLDEMTKAGLVEKHQRWRDNYYVNTPLVRLLSAAGTR